MKAVLERSHVLTQSGKMFELKDFGPGMVDIEDIAHNLSMECRFNGAVSKHYSVAEHSIIGANYMPAGEEIYFLLHDAHEAYIKDIPAYMKEWFKEKCEEGYKVLERLAEDIQLDIYLGLGIDPPDSKVISHIKRIDEMMLSTEISYLLPKNPYLMYVSSREEWVDVEVIPRQSRISTVALSGGEDPTDMENLFLCVYTMYRERCDLWQEI